MRRPQVVHQEEGSPGLFTLFVGELYELGKLFGGNRNTSSSKRKKLALVLPDHVGDHLHPVLLQQAVLVGLNGLRHNEVVDRVLSHLQRNHICDVCERDECFVLVRECRLFDLDA